MSKAGRIQCITRLEKARKSNVIAYVTSTRPGLEVPMAMDAVRLIYEHLLAIQKEQPQPVVDLFLHSNGGDGIVPWKLVTLIREYSKQFNVLIPHRAFSAATLTALGADNIVMHPMGMLGPTDPTVANPFNPVDPTNPTQRIGISVEDVSAYIALIREDAGIRHEDELVQAMNLLADKVHPLALGNVKRSLSQSRMMAKKLLSLHMDAAADEHKIDEIVDNLTSKLFYHGHPINRREATEHLGLASVRQGGAQVEKHMWRLYLDYEKAMCLDAPFRPVFEFLAAFPCQSIGAIDTTAAKIAKTAYIESRFRTDVFETEYQLSGQKQANGSTQVTPLFQRQEWSRE